MDKHKIGAAWVKTSKKGDKFFSGQVEIGGQKIKFVMFKNGFKEEGSNNPDWLMYESEAQEKKEGDIF